MHDIRLIRDNPQAFDTGLARRGLAPQSAEILAADAELRALKARQPGLAEAVASAATVVNDELLAG